MAAPDATNATFSGTLPPEDGGCDMRKGPYTVAPTDHVRALIVFADADNKRQDIVIHLSAAPRSCSRARATRA